MGINQASVEAAIDANAPLQDDFENNGPVDSDEERDAIMAAVSRSHPRPLETHVLMPTRKKYHYVRMKEMLSNVLGGARGGGLFSTGLFQSAESSTLTSPTMPEASSDASKKTTVTQSSASNRPATNPPSSKTAVSASS
jgi:hypothetical protein